MIRLPRMFSTRRCILLLLLVGAVGLGIRGWLRREPVNSDDAQYLGLAIRASVENVSWLLPQGWTPGEWGVKHIDHTRMRISFIKFLAVFIRWFGYSLNAQLAAVYAMAFLSFAALSLFAWVFSGPKTAVLAAMFWASSPICIEADARTVPDSFGTAMALLALALLAHAGGLWSKPVQTAKPAGRARRCLLAADAVVAGLLLWAAFSARASFVIFILAALVVAILTAARWRTLLFLSIGLAVGQILEFACFASALGDGLIRWKVLLGYGQATAGSSIFSGYTYADLFWRYPRLILHQAGSIEMAVFLLGWTGAIYWAVRFKHRPNLAKLVVLLGAYGFLAFGVSRLNPPVPLMREKIRYYATAAPLFYLAAADLLVAILLQLGRWRHAADTASAAGVLTRLRRFLAKTALTVCVATVVVLLCGNVVHASRDKNLVRNGRDRFLAIRAAVREHETKTAHAKVIHTDFRTWRIALMFFPSEDGWRSASIEEERPDAMKEDGYLVLNWQRLNGNAQYHYVHAYLAARFCRTIESQALLFRHRLGAYLTDVFIVGKTPLRREIKDLTDTLPSGWTVTDRKTHAHRVLADGEPILLSNRALTATGLGLPWRMADSGSLPGGHFVEVVMEASAEKTTALRCMLNVWTSIGKKRPTQLYLGRAYADKTGGSFSFWTYLPEKAFSFRIILSGGSAEPVAIHHLKLFVLGKVPTDIIQQKGGAW